MAARNAGEVSPEQAGAQLAQARPAVEAVAHLATAQAMLYYAGEFAAILARLPGGVSCRDWQAVARCLWQLDDA